MVITQLICYLGIFCSNQDEADLITWSPSKRFFSLTHTGEVLGSLFGPAISKKLNVLEDFNVAEKVRFYYYTQEDPEGHELNPDASATASKGGINRPLKMIIHGYLFSSKSATVVDMRKALLTYDNVSVIEVDWSLISQNPHYLEVAQMTELVGRFVARIIDSFIESGLRPEDIHLIGHSLGAHISGFAGSEIKRGKIERITGLDPALPGFQRATDRERLDPSDASFVDCIHTCGGLLGIMDPICHADFYPNGGKTSQPGCFGLDVVGFCSHMRAADYFTESINPGYNRP